MLKNQAKVSLHCIFNAEELDWNLIVIVIVYWYLSRSLKAELQGRSVTITEDNTVQKQSNR